MTEQEKQKIREEKELVINRICSLRFGSSDDKQFKAMLEHNIDLILDKTIKSKLEAVEMEIAEIETPLFEGASGFNYNSGWNDGEKSARYHLKAEVLEIINKHK